MSASIHSPLLLRRAEVAQHEDHREVADHRRLGLQLVVQPQAAVGEVLADHRHVEVAAVAAAEVGRQCVAQPARGVGAAAHLAQQLLPLRARRAAVGVGARHLAAVVEEARAVTLLQRRDLRVDEGVELGEDAGEVRGELEIHGGKAYSPDTPSQHQEKYGAPPGLGLVTRPPGCRKSDFCCWP